MSKTLRIHVQKGWFFWQAWNPDQVLALMECYTKYRSFSKAYAIEKVKRANMPRPRPEELIVELPDAS